MAHDQKCWILSSYFTTTICSLPLHDGALRLAEALLLVATSSVRHIDLKTKTRLSDALQ